MVTSYCTVGAKATRAPVVTRSVSPSFSSRRINAPPAWTTNHHTIHQPAVRAHAAADPVFLFFLWWQLRGPYLEEGIAITLDPLQHETLPACQHRAPKQAPAW